jgi:multicomponent Na+:H+ antiporter subunit G
MIVQFLSYICICVGLIFWFWGTPVLLGKRSVLFKLHNLSVSDTLGSILIIFGLLLQRPRELPLLVLAILSLALWNTMLGYVLAYCSSSGSLTRRNSDG